MANYTLIGVPGSGKTYFGTSKIVQQLKKKYNNKKFLYPLSNYPVKHKKYGSAYRFVPELIYLPIQNCYNVIDEGYQYFGQNKKKNYKLDYEVFFGTVRHNNVDNLIIAHGMTRINSDIRDKSEVFYVVSRIGFPRVIYNRPFFFNIKGYTDLGFVDNPKVQPFEQFYVKFNKSIAQSYDTHYFKKPDFDMNIIPSWDYDSLIEEPNKENILNWINGKIEVNDTLSKSEVNSIKKNDGFVSNDKANKIVKNGEIINWNNEIVEQSSLDFIST